LLRFELFFCDNQVAFRVERAVFVLLLPTCCVLCRIAVLLIDLRARLQRTALCSPRIPCIHSFRALTRYNIPEQCRLDLTETDIKFAKSLLEKVIAVSLHTPT
jgi:hypothetical protein